MPRYASVIGDDSDCHSFDYQVREGAEGTLVDGFRVRVRTVLGTVIVMKVSGL